MKLDYNKLKKAIIKSCKQDGSNILNFSIMADSLNRMVENSGLIFLFNDFNSEAVTGSNLALISEYFKNEKLAWFNRSRHFISLSFVVANSLDEEGLELVTQLKNNRSKDPDFDRVKLLAKIISKYPCYNALVVAYRSDDPNRIGKNSYTIMIRGNVNAILAEEEDYYNDEENG